MTSLTSIAANGSANVLLQTIRFLFCLAHYVKIMVLPLLPKNVVDAVQSEGEGNLNQIRSSRVKMATAMGIFRYEIDSSQVECELKQRTRYIRKLSTLKQRLAARDWRGKGGRIVIAMMMTTARDLPFVADAVLSKRTSLAPGTHTALSTPAIPANVFKKTHKRLNWNSFFA